MLSSCKFSNSKVVLLNTEICDDHVNSFVFKVALTFCIISSINFLKKQDLAKYLLLILSFKPLKLCQLCSVHQLL